MELISCLFRHISLLKPPMELATSFGKFKDKDLEAFIEIYIESQDLGKLRECFAAVAAIKPNEREERVIGNTAFQVLGIALTQNRRTITTLTSEREIPNEKGELALYIATAAKNQTYGHTIEALMHIFQAAKIDPGTVQNLNEYTAHGRDKLEEPSKIRLEITSYPSPSRP